MIPRSTRAKVLRLPLLLRFLFVVILFFPLFSMFFLIPYFSSNQIITPHGNQKTFNKIYNEASTQELLSSTDLDLDQLTTGKENKEDFRDGTKTNTPLTQGTQENDIEEVLSSDELTLKVLQWENSSSTASTMVLYSSPPQSTTQKDEIELILGLERDGQIPSKGIQSFLTAEDLEKDASPNDLTTSTEDLAQNTSPKDLTTGTEDLAQNTSPKDLTTGTEDLAQNTSPKDLTTGTENLAQNSSDKSTSKLPTETENLAENSSNIFQSGFRTSDSKDLAQNSFPMLPYRIQTGENDGNLTTKPLTWEEVSYGITLPQDDPRMLAYIREHHIISAPYEGTPVNWPPIRMTPSKDQEQVVDLVLNLLQEKTDGTYIECGAGDGANYSNTRKLEELGWKGLLIEADPRLQEQLLARHRKAIISPVCISPTPMANQMIFERHNTMNGLTRLQGNKYYSFGANYINFTAQCFPLYSIAAAVNITTVDYLSLDIEGSEFDVLKTIPWNKMSIKVISVGVFPKTEQLVFEYLTKTVGYNFITLIKNGKNTYSVDQIYLHASLQLPAEVELI